jgi:hypothetical protein
MNRSALALTAGLVCLGLVSCGGGGSSGKSTGTTAESSTSESVPGPAASGPQAKAQAVLFQMSDFPPGWTSTPHQADTSSKDDERKLRACVGLPPKSSTSNDLNSPDFKMGDSEADSSSTVVGSEQKATEEINALGDPKAVPCLRDSLVRTMQAQMAKGPGGATIGDVTLSPTDVGQNGDRTVAFQVVVPVTVQNQTITLTLDLVLIRIGQVGITDTFIGTGQPFDRQIEQQLLTKSTQRATAA